MPDPADIDPVPPDPDEGDPDWGPDWVEHKVHGMTDMVPLAKAHFIGRDVQPSNVKQPEERHKDQQLFERSGSLAPPYDPSVLCKLWEHSNSLRQNVDAYVVNIDGNGHSFEPVIDLESDDAFDQVRDAMFLELLTEAEDEGKEPEDLKNLDFPSDAAVEGRNKEMTDAMRLEKAKLDAFFRFCCVDESFISLRMKSRQDKEVMGNGYWEILRNSAGEPAQFTYIPGFTVRLLPLDQEPVEITQKIKRSPLSFEDIQVFKRFRRFVQVFEGRKVFYKEFGDPRVVSSRTGEVFKDSNALNAEEGKDLKEEEKVVEATEMLHFPIHSPRSPYGIPRWIGTLLAVLGSRQAEEVNFLYFENKGVPPMALLVSGGRLSSGSVKKVESFIENRLKGRSNFHKIMVIEADPTGGPIDPAANASGRMRLEIVPLTGAQHSDALFQNYDERNIDKVGMSFRLPRLLRGDIRDFNRATAEAALEFAETQVFAPEREGFDWTINRKLLTDLAIKFWTFVSNSPTTRNPLDLAEIISSLVKNSILTPEEARELAKGIFNRDFKKIEDLWVKIPPELLKAGILPESETGDLEIDEGDTEPEPIEDADLDTGDLRTGGGLKVPAQGRPGKKKKPRRKDGFVRLPGNIPGKVGKRYRRASNARQLRKLAVDLLDLRAVLLAEEKRSAADGHAEAQAVDLDKETIRMSAEEFAEMIDPAAE